MLTRRLIPIVLLMTIGLLISWPDSRPNWTVAAQELGYEEEIAKGRDFFRRSRYDDALKSFKRANELREKKCAECYAWMAETYRALEAYKNVIESADKVIELANGDRQLILKAYNNKGLALQTSANNKDQKKLQAAEAVFKEALALEGAPPILRYNLGVTLLQLNRDEEGVAELKQYITLEPRGPFIDLARGMVANPRRARENFAPDFSFTSSEGEHIALEDLRGKVVLLDFWGTWCSPCVESVPELRSLHKRYSKDGTPFVLIGISSDSDEAEWKEFTAKNQMSWAQYRDKDRRIQRAFAVRSFPTYIVIDHEGVVRFRSEGLSWRSAADLDQAIKKQIKIVAKSADAR
ncbi:MAG TPA: redoxin domain-containing protein [Pyrinomonadaceae bacterium]|nr:redoxin domain-containing protein [Pyrinomonadaceae bacterium]